MRQPALPRQEQRLHRCFTVEAMRVVSGSADGVYVAAGGASGGLYIWEAATGRLLRTWSAHFKVRPAACSSTASGQGVCS